MDIPAIIEALGGGLPAAALLGLGFMYWRSQARNDALTDRIMDMSAEQTKAMTELARQIEKSTERAGK